MHQYTSNSPTLPFLSPSSSLPPSLSHSPPLSLCLYMCSFVQVMGSIEQLKQEIVWLKKELGADTHATSGGELQLRVSSTYTKLIIFLSPVLSDWHPVWMCVYGRPAISACWVEEGQAQLNAVMAVVS